MKIPVLRGVIKRRILVNYQAEPGAVQKILPAGFRPKLHNEKAIAGICLIRLEKIHPKFAPELFGMASENAAHRIAVLWEENGEEKEGVFIPRRDTDSMINHLAGGRLFPSEHNLADFSVTENGNAIDFAMKSRDEEVEIKFKGSISEEWPKTSVFSSVDEASSFFEKGALGYSVTKDKKSLDGITLKIDNWKVEPLALESVSSSFYENETIFPKGSMAFDHALIMRNIPHEWHSAPEFKLQ